MINMILLVVVTCCIGVAAAGADDEKDEIESVTVSEGGNLSISIHIKKSEEDPQVLVTCIKGSSQQLIAQLICHNRVCAHLYGKPGVSLIYKEENVTLTLMNVSYNQTGRYKISKLSSAQPENKIYNITVYKSPVSTISPDLLPSVMHSKSFTAVLTSACVMLLITGAIAIGVVYRKCRKAAFSIVQQDDDTPASSRFGSLSFSNI